MKKTLAIFGVIILALVVLGAVCLVAVHARLDASSRAYVDMSIPRIISPWDQQQLSVRASSDYLKNVSDEQMAFDFKNFSRLGKLKNYKGSKGTSFFLFSTKAGKFVTADYTANAAFQNGDAAIIVRLIQEDGDWRISRFVVLILPCLRTR